MLAIAKALAVVASTLAWPRNALAELFSNAMPQAFASDIASFAYALVAATATYVLLACTKRDAWRLVRVLIVAGWAWLAVIAALWVLL